jgi:hypothetical protein
MAIVIEALLNQNITVVFDSLDLASVDSGKLKMLRGPGTQAAVMDVPDMIVAIFPPEPMLVQVGEKRIRMTLQGASEIGSVPMWDYMGKCIELVAKPRPPVVAYGFNYDAIVGIEGVSATDILQRRFMGQITDIEGRLQGQIKMIVPRLKFQKERVSYDLILEPVNDGQIKAHLNAHFATPSQKLPPLTKFRSSFLDQYRYFAETLARLLD